MSYQPRSNYADKTSGAIFPAQKKNPKAPDLTGYITLTTADLDALVEKARNGDPIKLRLACWKRQSNQGGGNFLSVSGEPDGQGQPGGKSPYDRKMEGFVQGAQNGQRGGGGQAQGRRFQQQPQQNDDPFNDEIPF